MNCVRWLKRLGVISNYFVWIITLIILKINIVNASDSLNVEYEVTQLKVDGYRDSSRDPLGIKLLPFRDQAAAL